MQAFGFSNTQSTTDQLRIVQTMEAPARLEVAQTQREQLSITHRERITKIRW